MALYEFDVAVTKMSGAQTLKKYVHRDDVYVEGRKGSEYVLTFKNNSSHRVLMVASVDGLSVMDGKPASVDSTGYVVERWSTVTVPGWRIDDGKVAKFVFQPQGDSRDLTYVEALKADGVDVDASNQGVIGCLVFPEKAVELRTRGLVAALGTNTRRIRPDSDLWYSKGGPSLQSLSYPSAGGMSNSMYTSDNEPVTMSMDNSSSVGTGFGDDKEFKTSTVKFTRHDPKNPAETFVIMYDTIQGLRKRGVPVDAVKNPLKNAFPASPELADKGCRIPSNRR